MPLYFSNSYLELGTPFSQKNLPTPVVEPQLLLWNSELAHSLNMPFNEYDDRGLLAEYFSGNKLFEHSQPISQAYSGHQFGYFNPQLGDGRAHLLGDLTDDNGKAWDIQLKGSGTSHFSRQGDGRCALGPALREFIMSEAMDALGVPTTRCLAVVATGQAVYRETALPGAIVTRVASSHIRVGTFQFFAARKDTESLITLTEYAIKRHFPEIDIAEELASENILDFFAAVLAKQVELVVAWQRVGFIHGVMNTDNTAISGETIDYGPCAMMNHYHEGTVFSSIDKNARYAFGNQSKILQWNMARLADCLLLILNEDKNADSDEGEEIALAKITPLLQKFANDLQYGYYSMMMNKLGVVELAEGDVELVNDFLAIMQEMQLDYTQTFITLENNVNQAGVDELLANEVVNGESTSDTPDNKWQAWLMRWYTRIGNDVHTAKVLMQKMNPLVIPRNHHVEAILATTQKTGDLKPLHDFIHILKHPYENLESTEKYQGVPADGGIHHQTFCGT